MKRIETVQTDESDTIYVILNKEQAEMLQYEIKIYPREILRVRETYPGYVFCEEFENDGISLEVFSKQEDNGNQSYIVYFYYENEKYAVAGINDREFLKEIAVKYQEAIVDNYFNLCNDYWCKNQSFFFNFSNYFLNNFFKNFLNFFNLFKKVKVLCKI